MDIIEIPSNIQIKLKNITCAYCGQPLCKNNQDDEHVVGRRFVPKGSFNNQTNLILNSCKICNGIKADLEDDISAITMQPDGYGEYASNDELLKKESTRKGDKSLSRRSGKVVKDSKENLIIKKAIMPGVNFSFNIASPPQIDVDRIIKLAAFQLTGFFYYLTFSEETKNGYFWPGKLNPVYGSFRSDWGNKTFQAFSDIIESWDLRLMFITANEYFKVIIRRKPNSLCWGWGIEWNQKYRIIGFFGESDIHEPIVKQLPPLEYNSIEERSNGFVRYRSEIPFNPQIDKLFINNSSK